MINLPGTLLARSFLLMVILIVLSFAASVAILSQAEQQPRIRQMTQLVVSVVNLTRAAVLSAAPEWRTALLSELADAEGLHVQIAEPDDVLKSLPDQPPELWMMANKVRSSLGDNTRFAAERNGVEALWVSFFIGNEEFWVALPRERVEHPVSQALLVWCGVALMLSLLGAYFIARQVAQPLKRLAQAAQQVGLGMTPQPLPEHGAKEIVAVSRAFNQMSADIAANERERALVLAGISHDLRTPLARVRLAAELSTDELLRDGLAADVAQMDEVIRQFLDYARFNENERSEVSSLRPNERSEVSNLRPNERSGVSNLWSKEAAFLTDVQELVRETVLPFSAQARITLDLQLVAPFVVRPLLLKRALSNLLDNAIKYGGGEITVQLEQGDKQVFLTVADRGVGIPATERDAAKRPFVRLESARSNTTGSGLGLAIVERAARLNGGEFHLEDRAGGGLLAKLVLPN